MKKFLLKVLLFFVCVAVMDVLFGCGFSWLRSHVKGGSTANCEYIANKANEDIIILGSSRATHHYIPQIIEDSLRMSCYNCGEEGNGVVLAYGRLKMLTNRYKPSLILYEVTPVYDYEKKDPYSKYLGYLRPYYDKEGIKTVFDDFDNDFSSLKMLSEMYKNTGRLLPDVADNIVFRENNKGYSPLFGEMGAINVKDERDSDIEIDSLKLSYLEKLICLVKSKDIPIIFIVSPKFGANSDVSHYNPALDLCEKYDVPFFNFINYPPITSCPNLFQDLTHLNHKGSVTYTNMIVTEVLKNTELYSNSYHNKQK